VKGIDVTLRRSSVAKQTLKEFTHENNAGERSAADGTVSAAFPVNVAGATMAKLLALPFREHGYSLEEDVPEKIKISATCLRRGVIM
jgi:hypothetical protein